MADMNLCTDCGKCAARCPAHIDVPRYVRAFQSGQPIDNIVSDGKPVDCIECGYCSRCCPQKIDALAMIRELAMLDFKKNSMEAAL